MRRIIFLFGMILGFTFTAFAQIEGDVTDPKDKGIPGAMIIAIDSVRKTADTIRSDDRGFYSFNNLKPGKYKIQIKAVGFQPAILENILVKEDHFGLVEEDLYNGQRLDISLNPAKVTK